MDLRSRKPIDSFRYLVNTENNSLYDGTGSLITNLNLTASSTTVIID